MALGKRKAGGDTDVEIEGRVPAAEKIARLLALIATRDMETDDAALKLDGVGFSSREIADLLGVGTNYVNVAKHRKKTGSAKKGRNRSAD